MVSLVCWLQDSADLEQRPEDSSNNMLTVQLHFPLSNVMKFGKEYTFIAAQL